MFDNCFNILLHSKVLVNNTFSYSFLSTVIFIFNVCFSVLKAICFFFFSSLISLAYLSVSFPGFIYYHFLHFIYIVYILQYVT